MSPQRPPKLWSVAPGLYLPGRLRRILTLAGLPPAPVHPLARPREGDLVAAWGFSPLAPKAEAFARSHGLPLLRIEDAFLRSLAPGRARRRGDGPLGLLIDRRGGVHFDPAQPSDLEHLLATAPLDDTALLDRAREGMARLKEGDLSKYNLHDPDLPPPPPGYVLIIDQTRNDAAVTKSGATEGLFREMLFRARDDHPGARIVIRSHPETSANLRAGHFSSADEGDGVSLLRSPVAPRALLEGAIAVYTVSSQMGFEAILAGHRPHVLGRPFYAGWGLSNDQGGPLPRRHRRLTPAQLFAGAMILAPQWYDPCRDRLCSFEEALDQLEAEVRAYREDRRGHVACGMRLWKRRALQDFFGREKPVLFEASPSRAYETAQRLDRDLLVWGSVETECFPYVHAEASRAPAGQAAHETAARGQWAARPEAGPQIPPGGAGASACDAAPPLRIRRVEDGLLRSRGLGADLVPPLSLVADRQGISFDPRFPSDLESLLTRPLRPGQKLRAARLITALRRHRVTKYNLGGTLPDLPSGHRILVPGQVEDDASIRFGATGLSSNLALLQATRAANPEAVILWKTHPDVSAGLRPGRVSAEDLARLSVIVIDGADADAAISACDELWTITSGMGFEALLRGKPVTCFGAPFYAGWGLTRDLGRVPERRRARPQIEDLAWAALIGYPRCYDPLSRRPCPPEVVLERLASGRVLPRSAALRTLAKLQGLLAHHAALWRR